jgi:hypothetical protein
MYANASGSLDFISYAIGARAGGSSPGGMISSRAITDIAYLLETRGVPTNMNYQGMPWGFEAAQLRDRLSVLEASGVLKKAEGGHAWHFSGDAGKIKGRLEGNYPEVTAKIEAVMKCIGTLDDPGLREHAERLWRCRH